jgi:single-stranded-DNA-specific exonuclease
VLRKNWITPKPVDEALLTRLESELDVPRVVARILAARGKTDPAAARRFLFPDLSQLSSPFALLGGEAAIDRILHSLRHRKKILVFGDFDVDGVTGTALALRTLRELGADVDYLMPKRLVHGYGLSRKVLPDLIARKPDLLVTVDCGIRSIDEVAELAAASIDAVITDHHEPADELPPAVAVVDPKRPGDEYPDKRLAGVGVMFQLLRGLSDQLEHELDLNTDLDLVALGTVADVVPLDGENRVLVHEGLDVLNRREKIGVMALALEAGIERRLESWHLAYLLGPRINAAGRLGDAADAVRLLISSDTAEASSLAKRLDKENRRRQTISAETLQQALDAIERGTAGENPAGIVLASNVWHPGVIGIATAKLVERYHRPSVLIAMDGDTGRGSVRSIRGIDVCEVLAECEDLLTQYGGHEMAAGLSLARSDVPAFRERFAAGVGRRLDERTAHPELKMDAEIGAEEIDEGLVGDLDRLGPFGYGNSRPVFLLRNVRCEGRPRIVGRGHLKMALQRDGQPSLACIGFDLGDHVRRGFPQGPLDVVGHVSINEWNNRRNPQLQILDLREAAA